MIEAAVGLGIGALLARFVLVPVQVYLEKRQDRFDEAAARAAVERLTPRS